MEWAAHIFIRDIFFSCQAITPSNSAVASTAFGLGQTVLKLFQQEWSVSTCWHILNVKKKQWDLYLCKAQELCTEWWLLNSSKCVQSAAVILNRLSPPKICFLSMKCLVKRGSTLLCKSSRLSCSYGLMVVPITQPIVVLARCFSGLSIRSSSSTTLCATTKLCFGTRDLHCSLEIK